MTLTPKDIQDRQFHDAFRGYSHEEVDLFLDEVAEAFRRIFDGDQTLRRRVSELEHNLSQALATEDMLKRTLITAQRTAEEAVEEARAKAAAMEADGDRKAREIVASAEARASQILSGASAKQREIEARIESLKAFEQDLKGRLRTFLESQLRGLAAASGPSAPAPAPASPATAAPLPSPVPQPASETTTSAPAPVQAPPPSPVIQTHQFGSRPEAGPARPPEPVPVSAQASSSQASAPQAQAEDRPRIIRREPAPQSVEESSAADDISVKEFFWGEE